MIYLIHGEDQYLKDKKKKEILKYYQDLDYKVEVLNNIITFEDFVFQVKSRSLFDNKRVFLLKSFLEDKNFVNSLVKNFSMIEQKDIIFYEIRKIEEKQKIYKLIKKVGTIYYFPSPKPQDLRKSVKEELAKDGFRIEDIAINTIIDFVGKDTYRLFCEIEKLKLFKKEKKLIKTEDVLKMVRPEVDLNIFRLVESIAKQYKKEAIKLMNYHLQKGDSPIYLLSMIHYQFRNLIIFKEKIERKESVRDLSLPYFQLQKLEEMSSRFDIDKLKKIYHKLFKIDLSIKNGQLDPEEGLELLLLEI